jgi:hypothetical protein
MIRKAILMDRDRNPKAILFHGYNAKEVVLMKFQRPRFTPLYS